MYAVRKRLPEDKAKSEEKKQRARRIDEMTRQKIERDDQIEELESKRRQKRDDNDRDDCSRSPALITSDNEETGEFFTTDQRRNEIKKVMLLQQQTSAAILIQAVYRAKHARDIVDHMMKEQHSAVLIQAMIRGKKARLRVQEIRVTGFTNMSVWRPQQNDTTTTTGDANSALDTLDPRNVRKTSTKLRRYHYQNIGEHHSHYAVHTCGIHIDHSCRKWIFRVAESQQFIFAINILILIDCTLQAYFFQTKRNQNISNLLNNNINDRWIFNMFEIIATVIYFIEMIIKMAAYGVNCRYTKSYFNSWWNILDMIVFIISLLSLLEIFNHLEFVMYVLVLT